RQLHVKPTCGQNNHGGIDIQQTCHPPAVLFALTFIHQNVGCGLYVFVLGRVWSCDLSLRVWVALWESGPQKALKALLYSEAVFRTSQPEE
ncbi:uncharacterized, partial [Tachysurus ichikawai]